MSRLDLFYRKLLLTKFFTKGWGKPENLKRLFEFRKIISDRELCRDLVPSDYPIVIDKDEVQDECRLVDGHFCSPFTVHMPGIMPEEVQTARFQMVLPNKWNGPLKPVCVHLAGTGDHHFWRRRMFLARPMVKESNIGSVILENPFYGCRKPKIQFRSSLLNVSDLFVMGGALVLESLALFHWLERHNFGPLGVSGISMGGHMASVAATNWHRPISCVPCLSWTTASSIFTQMASLAASNWHKPLSLIPCLSWSTASSVFTQGVLSGAIPWELLQEQYKKDKLDSSDITRLIHSPEVSGRTKTDAFLLGQHFHQYVNNLSAPPQRSAVNGDVTCGYGSSCHASSEGIPTSAHSTLASSMPSSKVSPGAGSSPGTGIATTSATSSRKPPSFASRPLSSGSSKPSPPQTTSTTSSKTSSRSSWSITDRLLASFQSSSSVSLPGDALEFMQGVMDECTHLGNFSVPLDPSLIIIVSATNDAYVPRDRVMSLQALWPGAEVRTIDRGHIGAFLLDHHVFREAIKASFDRQIEKYYREDSAQQGT